MSNKIKIFGASIGSLILINKINKNNIKKRSSESSGIYFFNLQKIIAVAIKLDKELEKKFQILQQEFHQEEKGFQQEEKEFQQKQQELISSQSVSSPEVFQIKLQKLQTEIQEFQTKVQESQIYFQKKEQQIKSEFDKRILKKLEEYRKDKKIKILFDNSNGLAIYDHKTLDKTPDIIKYLNENM
jgi:Skp family chaperone for outer membrane proteins